MVQAASAQPLQRFPLCSSVDVAEFTHRLNSVYYPARVESPAARPPRTATLHAIHCPEFTLGYIRPGGSVRVTPLRDATTFHVNFALRGSARAVCDGEQIDLSPSTAAVHNVCEPHVLLADADSGILGVRLDRQLVEDELAGMLGTSVREPLRFAHRLDLTSGPGASLLTMTRVILEELSAPGLLDLPAVRTRYVRTLVAALLGAQRHSYSDALHDPGAPLRPRTLTRAIAFVEAHLTAPITVNDVAAAAGSSVRRLQEAFHEHLGVSPMCYLRDRRLDHAHRLLTDGAASVTDAAGEAGFTHLGRFSAAYRQRFAELPSETLTGLGRRYG